MLVNVLLLGLLGVLAWNRWHSEPDYWTVNLARLQAQAPEQLTDTADRLFNRLLTELSDPQGYQPEPNGSAKSLGVREVRIPFDQANAWLATRFGDWLANQQIELPPELDSLLVAEHDNRLVLAGRIRRDGINQILSIVVSPRFLENGQAVLEIDKVYAGRLPLPVGVIMNRIPENPGIPELARGIRIIKQGMPFDAVCPIDHTRRARIVGLNIEETGMTLTIRAERIRR
ncbi:MAG: hypothetical protein Kow00105_16570 [Phycisphaeraceae bacterium]